jgi:hypothetical protein
LSAGVISLRNYTKRQIEQLFLYEQVNSLIANLVRGAILSYPYDYICMGLTTGKFGENDGKQKFRNPAQLFLHGFV